MIKEIPDELNGSDFKPRHTIEIYCPNCGRDIDEAELAAKKCNDCGDPLEDPEQHVAIVVANMSFVDKDKVLVHKGENQTAIGR